MTTRSLLAIAALALSAVACGGSDGPTTNNGNGGNDNLEGTFTGTISGDLSRALDGGALFGTDISNDGFALILGDDDAGLIFGREAAGVLPAGAHAVYDLVDGDAEEAPTSALIGVIGVTINNVDYVCVPSGGTVTVTTSNENRLAGSVNIPADCHVGDGNPPKSVTFTGNFDAARARAQD